MKNGILFVGLAVMIGGIAAVGCNKGISKDAEKAPGTKAAFCLPDTLDKMLKVEEIKMEHIEDALNLSGAINFNDDRVVRVMPLISGRVEQVKVSLGDHVEAGQTLAVMKSFEVAGSYSDARSAAADVEINKKNLQSAEDMFKIGLISEKDLTQARTDYQKSLSTLDKTQGISRLYGEGGAGGEIIVKAPTSGYIVEKKVSAGSTIRNDNADNIFTIGNLNEVWVMANVFESDIAKIKEGYEAKITVLAYPGKVFTGKVDNISAVLDPNSKVMLARIRVANPGTLLKPQMFANIRIMNMESAQALAIPTSAVIFQGGITHVVTYVDKCHVAFANVDVIKTVGDKTYIRTPAAAQPGQAELGPGVKVITQRQGLVYNALMEELNK